MTKAERPRRLEPPRAASPPSAPAPDPAAAPRRLRRAEAVLARRTSRVLLVLERCRDSHNHQAALRTAEGLGIQHVWIVEPDLAAARLSNSVTKGAWLWLTLRRFRTTDECIAALREDGRAIWVADVGRAAAPLQPGSLLLPPRLAVVIGREVDGASPEMMAAADHRLYLPMHGFSGSFNLSVATALILQRLLDACPEARGDLPAAEKAALRERWYRRLAKSEQVWQEYRRWLEHPPPPLEELRPEDEFRRPRVLARWLRRKAAIHALD